VTAAARVYQTRRALRVEYPSDRGEPLVEELAITTAICAPVFVMGDLWGSVGASSPDHQIRSGSEARLARFAELVAVTISHAASWNTLSTRATTDALTGLANRGTLNDRLDEEIERGRRHRIPLSLALFDIDHFKKINDTHGHQAGDEVLVQVANLIAAQARTGELVARIGGEEFAWLMPHTDLIGACAATERARQAVESLAVDGAAPLTVSAGVSCTELAATAKELLATADRALYSAKATGRNATRPFTDSAQPDPR
jgi:diguanylate cyclase (GGDEF)-like protein